VPIELSTDLPTPLIPLAWLIGKWAGAGVIGYPTIEEARFGQEIEFSHDGRPFLSYRSQTWLLDDDGNQTRPLATETGFWRPVATSVGHADDTEGSGDSESDSEGSGEGTGSAGTEGTGAANPGTELEVLLAHPTGFVEIYLGTVTGPRIDLATDLVARTSTAKEYTAASRLYGLVESDLLWAMDMAAMGQPLQSHASARLKRL
jgi:nitrobindin-like protein